MLLRGPCLAVLAVVVAGCGGAAPPAAEAPTPTTQPAGNAEPSLDQSEAVPTGEESEGEDLASLQKRLDESERQLLAVVAPETSVAAGATAGSGGAARPAPKSTSPAPARQKPEDERRSGEVNRCDVACKALSSMRRSRDRICELTADDDARCTGATTRVDDATGRVTRAGCACSEE